MYMLHVEMGYKLPHRDPLRSLLVGFERFESCNVRESSFTSKGVFVAS